MWLGNNPLKKADTCNPLSLGNAFVSVQLHVLGNPQSVQPGNTTTTTAPVGVFQFMLSGLVLVYETLHLGLQTVPH